MPSQADKNLALQLHNTARASAPGPSRQPLVWSRTLEAAAHSYAQQLVHLSRGLPHSAPETRPGQGENLSWCSKDHSLAQSTQMWINEIRDYRGEKVGEEKAMVGHYTQVIWPDSLKVGIAKARGASGETYIVARYSPMGNWIGQSPWGNFRGKVEAPRMDHVPRIEDNPLNGGVPMGRPGARVGIVGRYPYIQPIYEYPKMGEVVQGVKKVAQQVQKKVQERRQVQGQRQGDQGQGQRQVQGQKQVQRPQQGQVQPQGGVGGGADHQWMKNVIKEVKDGVTYEYKGWQNRKQARK